MIVIGDVHGCFDTLQALLSKLPDDDICFVGDLIDRGPKSKETVEFVMNSDYLCVAGNHELMMADWTGRYSDMLWLGNGGQQTLNSYKEGPDELGLHGELDKKTFEEHRKWMKELPIYIHFKNTKDDKGRSLVVSHSHIHNVWERLHKAIESDENNEKFIDRICNEIVWGRPNTVQPTEGIYNIIGHTPQETARVKSFYSNIDTGCFYKGAPGAYNHLTAMQFPSMEIWTQECIDDVKW